MRKRETLSILHRMSYMLCACQGCSRSWQVLWIYALLATVGCQKGSQYLTTFITISCPRMRLRQSSQEALFARLSRDCSAFAQWLWSRLREGLGHRHCRRVDVRKGWDTDSSATQNSNIPWVNIVNRTNEDSKRQRYRGIMRDQKSELSTHATWDTT